MKTNFLVSFIFFLFLGVFSNTVSAQSINTNRTKFHDLFCESFEMLIFDREEIRDDFSFGIGEELVINVNNLDGFSLNQGMHHLAYKLTYTQTLDEGLKSVHEFSELDFKFPPQGDDFTIFAAMVFDHRFKEGKDYTAKIHFFDKNQPSKYFDIHFKFKIDAKYNLPKLETTSCSLGMDYLATYFSTEGKLPANTNVFQYDKEGPFDIKYYVETISNKTPELNATANIYLVYYGNGANQYSRNFTTFPIGRGIQLNNFQSNMSASYKIGNTSFRAIGKGAYAILTVVNQPSLDKKLMLIDNFYVTDEEWICNNIQFKDNKRKHVNLRENAEPTLFGRRHDYEFLRYLQFYFATLIEDTDYITNEKVSLHYTINEKGDVTDIEVKNCSTPWIAKQLQKIAYGCPKFTPKMVDGVPQASSHELVVPVSMDYE